jgi:acetyl esterase/lipase
MTVRLLGVAVFVVLLGSPLLAVEPVKSKSEPKVVPLWTEKAPGAVGEEDRDRPTLTIHLPEATKATGTGVIVCPGGGYTIHVVDHEGQQVARWLNSIGVAAFVLKYRLKPRYQPADALLDGKRALRYVRQHAEEFGVSPKRVGIIGFSAGGHLAASTGIDFDDGDAKATDLVERQSSRPDFMVLVYGGTTVVGDPGKKDEGKTFTAKAPPAFLLSTDGDKATDVLLDCYRALRKVNVPAEMHAFGGYGPHGVGLGAGDPAVGVWPEQLHAWLRKSGLLTTAERAVRS